MKILGIGGQGYRDSSAALVVDGRVVAAASEERFTRVKHEGGFPRLAAAFCLRHAGLTYDTLDRIAVADNAWLGLRAKLLEWYGDDFLLSRRFRTFGIFHDEIHAATRYLSEVERFRTPDDGRFRLVRHHLCHLAEAYYLSPFKDTAILVLDGRGQASTSAQAVGRGGEIEVFAVEEMPNSIGLLAAGVADFLGFREEDDEFRIMSISSIGEPRYLDTFRKILRPAPDGAYLLNQDYFDTFEGRAFLSERLPAEVGPGREPGTEVEERHADIAASLQCVLEEIALHMARHLAAKSGHESLCLAGGVAQNWVLGGRIRADGPFRQVHTGFAAGDEGTAIGAALAALAGEHGTLRASPPGGGDLGPAYDSMGIRRRLARLGLMPESPEDPIRDAAERIAAGRLLGWFSGSMEFGPRALGHRSILLDPTSRGAKSRLVATVKSRARYHPFGIAVRDEDLSRFFIDVRPDPNMTSHRVVRAECREALEPVLHVDGTARVQTVAPGTRLSHLLGAVGLLTGQPVLLNTSLNTPGKPLARTPEDAVETFYTSGLDDLYLEDLRLSKAPAQEV